MTLRSSYSLEPIVQVQDCLTTNHGNNEARKEFWAATKFRETIETVKRYTNVARGEANDSAMPEFDFPKKGVFPASAIPT